MSVVLRRIVLGDTDGSLDHVSGSGSHFQSQVKGVTSVDGINTLIVDVINQRNRDATGRLSVKTVNSARCVSIRLGIMPVRTFFM